MKTSVFQLNPNNQYQNMYNLSLEQTYQKNKQDAFLTHNKIAFILSFVLHLCLVTAFYKHFHNSDLAQNGDYITTLALATFQTPSNQEVENPQPKPIIHKKKKYHKEFVKEHGKFTKKEEESLTSSKTPKAKPDEKIEEGDRIQTLSFHAGSEDELFSKIQRAIDRKNKYPPMARKRGLEGEVVVEFIIYKDGKVANIRLVKPCSHDPFNIAAINAIKKAQNDFPRLSETTKIRLPIIYELDRV